MNVNQQEGSFERQSAGCDPKTSSKRNSGLFSFLRWFKPSTSRESLNSDALNSPAGSCDSLNSINSVGTVASFSYVPPTAYKAGVCEKSIVLGPETDTYKARLKQRDKRREKDKNTTLRKKYNLFFNRDSLLRPPKEDVEDNSKSLPLMTRKTMEKEEEKVHRRTNSESSKIKKAGAYCHVKGKRKAPQPPSQRNSQDGTSTTSLRRKKRAAPQPPNISADKVMATLDNTVDEEPIIYADHEVIYNDFLKLDHGILKPLKEKEEVKENNKNKSLQNLTVEVDKTSNRASYVEAPVSPRPWYKRNGNRDSVVNLKKEKSDNKYEPIEPLPAVQFIRSTSAEATKEDRKYEKISEEKRKSGLTFLTNITELDREACEIIRKEKEMNATSLEGMPEFMKPKAEPDPVNTDTLSSPKRKSARDLIAKFNAITNVTKVTVNSSFFRTKDSSVTSKEKRDYFGRPLNKSEQGRKKTTSISLEENASASKVNDDNKNYLPLMKSESVSSVKTKFDPKGTPKADRKSWKCPKCFLENDYWRIICSVCSTIKPYFDDLTSAPTKTSPTDKKRPQNNEAKASVEIIQSKPLKTEVAPFERNFERAKTQIGFSRLAKYNENTIAKEKADNASKGQDPQTADAKREEKEKLKKMLIEMKNSLPKRMSNVVVKQNGRASIIDENPENNVLEQKAPINQPAENSNTPLTSETASRRSSSDTNSSASDDNNENVIELTVATTESIYENIKMKRTENPKPVKVSSSAQTSSAIIKKENIPASVSGAIKKEQTYQLIGQKDFVNIYNDKTKDANPHLYTNVTDDNMSLFFNMPRKFAEIKNNLNQTNNTDTLEVNRLLRRLESAIAKGEMSEAAIFARELAQLKVNCSVVRQKPQETNKKMDETENFTINLYVEDKISHRGPFPISVTENQTVLELKKQVEKELEIPADVQRWILGKELAHNDSATLKDHHVTVNGQSVFLYLVAPSKHQKPKENVKVEITTTTQAESAISKPLNTSKESPVLEKQKNIEKYFGVSNSNIIEKPSTSFTKSDNVVGKKQEDLNKLQQQPKIKETIEIDIIEKPKEHKIEPSKLINNIATIEDDDYDTKTLKANSWVCRVCTLINPSSSNICSVCASVRKFTEPAAIIPSVFVPSLKKKKQKAPNQVADEHYLQLVNLDNADLVENIEPFECLVCMNDIGPGKGVTLRECLHQFCKLCLAYTIEFNDEAEVKCPYRDADYSCDLMLQDREIKALVSAAVYEQHLAKSVKQAENKTDKSFHCKTPDCKGWCIFEDNVNDFRCPVCKNTNCLTCQAIHTGLNCKQYQERMNLNSETNDDAKQTKKMLDEMVAKGEAIVCPACQVVLMKKWGCDWVRCSMCKTEICWVTRGPRWGPGGKGDTSGGCKCGVNGVKCHPQCNYCH